MPSETGIERTRNTLTYILAWIAMSLAAIDIPVAIVALVGQSKFAISLPWYHYGNFSLRVAYDLLIIVSMALLLAGPLTNSRAKVVSILSLFGVVLVIGSMVMIALEAWAMGPFELAGVYLWRVCVLVMWIMLALSVYHYDAPSCRNVMPYYVNE